MLFPRPFHHVACAAALVLVTSISASAQYANLSLQSQPGDYIGQGQNYNYAYTPASTQGGVFATTGRLNASGVPDYVRFMFSRTLQPDGTYNASGLTFTTEGLGTALTPGTYDNARRADTPPSGYAGFEVTLENRGSNTLSGAFTVTDFTYTLTSPSTFVIDSFAASFVQHSEEQPPALSGTFTYNIDSPAAVPEASTTVSFSLLLALGLGSAVVAARKKKSAA